MHGWNSMISVALMSVSLAGPSAADDTRTSCYTVSGNEAIAACNVWIESHPQDAVAFNNINQYISR